MSLVLASLLAGALQFHGILGQSAAPGEPPLRFTGVKSIVELPGERVLFIGDDGRLYEIDDGRPVFTGKAAKGNFLDFDGMTLRSIGQYTGVWEIDLDTLESRQTISPGNVRWDLAGVRPDGDGHHFAGKCKFVTWDPSGDRVVAYNARGAEVGVLMPTPERKENCRIEGFGFLPDCGDLVMVSYWPDMRIRRFRADGSEVVGNGWPLRRGMGFLRTSGGRLLHCGTSSILPLAADMGKFAKAMKVGRETVLTGYARQGGREFIGTSQGLYVKERGETSFNRRFGGIGRLTALAVCDGKVFMSMGEKIRWMYLDGDGNEPFGSSDTLEMRIDNGKNWKDRILDIAPLGPGILEVAAGDAGRWRFSLTPPLDYANHRNYWTQLSKDRCERVEAKQGALPSPSELAAALAASDIPGGFEIGKFAFDGEWLVVEDVKNHRLLRFRCF